MKAAWRVAEIRAAEEALMATLPDGTLMQRAAAALARRCASLLADRRGGVYGRRVLLLVGGGNNGGDALFAGASLARRGALVMALPLTKATRGLIGARELGLMKPAAILVNVSRGAIVDERALYEHLRDHPEFCAGIDAWWHEPGPGSPFVTGYPFFDLPNVIGSPHNSGVVAGALQTGARWAAENVLRFLTGGPVTGMVRREDYL